MRRKISLVFLLLLSLASSLPAKSDKTFALVLSGGGAKGYAHIAVLQELDRRGIVPDVVIGTSMGALIGGLYAAGHTGDEILEICQTTDINALIMKPQSVEREDVLDSPFSSCDKNLLRVSMGSAGIIGSGGLINDKYLNSTLRRLVIKQIQVTNYDDLSIPFRAVTTDIITGERIVLSSGPLHKSMRASMSIPILFAPVPLDDGVYGIDGGFTSNMSTDVARELGYDIVLAVDVNDDMRLYGEPERDFSTLSGTFDTFSDYLSSRNMERLYELADYVIVPKTQQTYNYNAVDEMHQAGVIAVQQSQDAFDDLERRVGGGKSRPLYHDLEDHFIQAVVTPEISPAHRRRLEGYVGKVIDFDTLSAFENDLDQIRLHSRLRTVDYEIRNDVIYVTTEEYKGLYGELALGFEGSVGVRYDGDDTYFMFQPDFTVSGTASLSSALDLDYALSFDKGLKLSGGVSYPLLSSSYVYADFGLQYGQLSWATVPGTNFHEFGNDVSLDLTAGFGQMLGRKLRWDAVTGIDYTFISEIKDSSNANDLYAFTGGSLVFDGYRGKNKKDNGIDAEARLTLGIDVPDPALGYAFDLEALGVFGSEQLKFFFSLDLSTVRRPRDLAAAYRVTKTGRMTPDEVCALLGVAVPLPASCYVAGGFFMELSDPDARDGHNEEWEGSDFLPFSRIEGGETAFGGYVSGGIMTKMGLVYASIYVSSYPGVSFLIGLR